ncbi:phosphoribosylformylglycinamidine synthase subunit PurQ [Candidatus Sumerlaeota bacterium]|nr:phosphoribosylformylglycinamidine synthase subunit PurQ [Candidatus Sumerlaeota bacterium]
MKAGVVIFPGSNCDQDMIDALERVMGWEVRRLWHKETELPEGLDLIALPGGFSYGDYLRCGAIARFSPIMRSVVDFAARGGWVLGVCNGFQILTESGLLPGALLRNRSLRFRCHDVFLRVERHDTIFTDFKKDVIRVPIAHGEGCYTIDAEGLKRIEGQGQVIFRYCDEKGKLTDAANPNGSLASIAGICNEAGNVLGMMPHPERVCEECVGGEDGKLVFASIERAAGALAAAK